VDEDGGVAEGGEVEIKVFDGMCSGGWSVDDEEGSGSGRRDGDGSSAGSN
jgi:hypothetical protein